MDVLAAAAELDAVEAPDPEELVAAAPPVDEAAADEAPVDDAPAAAPPVLEAVAEAVPEPDADDDDCVVDPEEAFREPQTRERQPVWPPRSLGWAATQSIFHCAQTKEGIVWS